MKCCFDFGDGFVGDVFWEVGDCCGNLWVCCNKGIKCWDID